jgi:hypothetical protein
VTRETTPKDTRKIDPVVAEAIALADRTHDRADTFDALFWSEVEGRGAQVDRIRDERLARAQGPAPGELEGSDAALGFTILAVVSVLSFLLGRFVA